MRVAIYGCGAVGTRLARQLIAHPQLEQLVLRDIRRDHLRAVAASLGDRVVTQHGSRGDPPEVDVVVLATPSGSHGLLARRALSSGASVVSTSASIPDVQLLLALDEPARERGATVVAGAGFSPGLSCVIAGFGASRFTRLDEIHIAKSGTGGPACARQHHRALGGAALDWRDGQWHRRRGGSGRELSWFPEPVGGRDCYRAALPDAILLVPAFPGVQRVTARMSATRRDRLTMKLPMLLPPHAEAGPGAARVELRGWRGDAREVVVLGVMDRPVVAAAATAALATRWVVEGRIPHGAAGLGRVGDPPGFLRELTGMGIRAAVFDGTPRAQPRDDAGARDDAGDPSGSVSAGRRRPRRTS